MTFIVLGDIFMANKQSLLTGAPGRSLLLFALPIIIGNLFQQFYNMADSVIVGRFVGEQALAAVGASYSFTNIFIMVAIGGGIGSSVLTSQYLGAGQLERAKEGYRISYIIILCFGAIIFIVSQLFYRPLLSFFMEIESSPVAYATGESYVRFIGCFLSFLGFKACTDGILRGAGDVIVYMLGNLLNLSIRVAVAQLCSPVWGIQFVWYAVPLGWFVNYVISYLWYRTGHWKRKELVKGP